jgi:hypothetical protein
MPQGVVPAGTTPVVAMAAAPSHPCNVVQILMRREAGAPCLVHARPEATHSVDGQQWFRARLPTVNRGRRVDYRVELSRFGRCLASLPLDGSWLSVIGDAAPNPPSCTPSPARPNGAPLSAGIPLWSYHLEFLAAMTLNLRSEIIGKTPEGYRIDLLAEGGRVVGPNLNAVVRPEGGDWMCVRRDGIGVMDVRLTWETADGGLILEEAGGVLDLGRDGYAKAVAGQFTGCPPLYATVTWATAHPDWQWLNRCQGFGIGRVLMEKLQVQCDFYIPRVLERLNDG